MNIYNFLSFNKNVTFYRNKILLFLFSKSAYHFLYFSLIGIVFGDIICSFQQFFCLIFGSSLSLLSKYY